MKKFQKFIKRIVTLSIASLTFLSTIALNQTLTNVHGLYTDNTLVGHGFDALSTKNDRNKPDKGTISLPLISGCKVADFEGSLSFSDQNGDPEDMSTLTLYPGETFHVHYKIKYTPKTAIGLKTTIRHLGAEDFISFRPDFFTFVSPVKLNASNTSNNATVTTSNIIDEFDGLERTQISFLASQIQPDDEFTVDFDLQAAPDLKARVLADAGEFPAYYNMTTFISTSSAGTQLYTRSLSWTQAEAKSTINKKQLDSDTYQMELTNTTSGSLFGQVIDKSMLTDSENIEITNIAQIHTDKNPFIDYVDLSINKGTQITTNDIASNLQLNIINTELQSSKFIIDEVQQGTQVIITYKVK